MVEISLCVANRGNLKTLRLQFPIWASKGGRRSSRQYGGLLCDSSRHLQESLGPKSKKKKKVSKIEKKKKKSQKRSLWGSAEKSLKTPENCTFPRGPNDQKIKFRSKFSISIEILNLARKFQSRRLEFPTKNKAAVGGSLENFIFVRNLQSRSKSRFF